MRLAFVFAVLAVSAGTAVAGGPQSTIAPDIAPSALTQLVAASLSCTPRKTCTRIGSCDEAYWYFVNCSWGSKLDGDNDGIPCESLCR